MKVSAASEDPIHKEIVCIHLKILLPQSLGQMLGHIACEATP